MADVDTVRLLTGIGTEELTNQQITDLLALNDGGIKLTAADVLETVASQLTSVQSDDISIDGSKRAAVLMARAARLRSQVEQVTEDDGFFFGVVDGPGGRPELTERECW